MPSGPGLRPAWSDHRTAIVVSAGYAFLLGAAIAMQAYPLAALPLVVGVVALALSRRDWLLLGLVATVPLSLNLEQLEIGGVGLYLPTEPLLFGLLLLFLLDRLRGVRLDAGLESHPITRCIQVMFVWLAITTLTSSDPLVSFKFLVARGWFVVGFFFLLAPLLTDGRKQERFVLLYLVPLLAVIVYTVVRHAGYGFEKQAGHWVMDPFFKDHTSYGAVLAMFWFPALAMLLKPGRSALGKLGLAVTFSILTAGLILSFTRAAWVSVAAAGAVGALMMLGIRLRTLVGVGISGLVVLLLVWDQLLISLERNDQDSSDDLTEHVESISNVSSDASNLERINRWSCAIALWQERPLVGWGAGTYQFVYAPFQRSEHRTIISTNNADRGNAHSEYLGPLAEQGVPGALIILALLWWTTVIGFRVYRALRHEDTWNSWWALSVYLGVLTYFIHGVLNNYLDTDKASAPFWGFLAMLVMLDLKKNGWSAGRYRQRGLPSDDAAPNPR
ncbi:MAG: O-antigen ligase family protein [Crocinitomicaceae bacterium TMED114]|nr:MAG: O-antigen ligase family protein [Crocinitomicaceae bacterium TMED114]